MKFSEVITYINQALNYPSATVGDLQLFINQAIAELNTELKISLPSIEKMKADLISTLSAKPNIFTTTDSTYVSKLIKSDTDPISYNSTSNTFKHKDLDTEYEDYYYIDISNGTPVYYKTNPLADAAMWIVIDPFDIDMSEYLPDDWIYLFVIPYVCYKYSVRDGDTGVLFSEEFSQGYTQLRNSYGIPSKVRLFKVAHLPAYRHLVTEDNLNTLVYTRAITDDMKLNEQTYAEHDTFYNHKGGWGV